MWYLLVAAGAGYLVQRWQHTHKPRFLSRDQWHNQSPSAPSSGSAISRRSSFALSGTKETEDVNNANTTSDGSINKEDTSVGCGSQLLCFVTGSAEDSIPYQPVSKSTIDSPQCDAFYPQVLKSNKRSACEAFSVPVPDTCKPIQGDKKDQIVPNPGSNLGFPNIKENTLGQFESSSRSIAESASIQGIAKGQLVSPLKPSVGSTNIQWYAREQAVSNLEHNPDFVNIDNKEHLRTDSTPPSSYCSSSSTVINSPVGRKPFLHKLEPFQFQAIEQSLEINVCEQLSTPQNTVVGRCGASFLENDDCKASGQGVFLSMSKYNCSQDNYPKALQNSSPGNCLVGAERSNINAVTSFKAPVFVDDTEVLAASAHGPHVFTGENQKGITRTEHFFNEFMCTDKVELDMKQSARSLAGGANFSRKVSSFMSASPSVATESACEAESESLVSFGLAMAVFLMVSSAKMEMEKMGKVLRKTEDLVSDMRKELEERRDQSCVPSSTLSDSGCNEKLLAIKSKGPLLQVSKTDYHIDSLCQVGQSDDESIRSVLTEEHGQYELHIHNFKTGHEAELQLVENEVGCHEKLLTIKSKDPVAQVSKTDAHTTGLCQVGYSSDESIRSVVTDELTQYGLQIHDLHAGHEAELQLVENDGEVSVDGSIQNEECDSKDEKDSSTPEETGEDNHVLSLLELERKLWKIFQERQEEKILELEASLDMVLSKLQEKEEELQWWKNRAEWLMEHSMGSTSGSISVDNRVERLEEGFNHTNLSSLSIKACDAGKRISRKSAACDMNTPELSDFDMNFLALEEWIEIVDNADGPMNTSGHQNQMERVGSDCSISSSEESHLSLDVRTFMYP